jgi:two-component system, cell cycle sensor histidine kinase and response regulator CckA
MSVIGQSPHTTGVVPASAKLRDLVKRHGPHASVAFLCLVFCAILWAGLLVQMSHERERIIESKRQENDNLARVFEEHVARTIRAAEVMLREIASEYRRYGLKFDLVAYAQGRSIYLDPYFILSIVDAKGDRILANPPLPTQRVNLSETPDYRYHAQHDAPGLFISAPRIGVTSGKWTIFLSIRINNADGSFGGYANVGMDPVYFSATYSELQLGKDSIVTLLGRDGIVRARSAGADRTVGQNVANTPLFTKFLPAATHGSFIGISSPVDGTSRIVSYRALQNYPLVVLVGTSQAAALSDVNQRTSRYVAGASGITLVILCLGLFTLFQIERSRRGERRLRESEARFRSLTELSSDWYWEQDEHFRFIVMSAELYPKARLRPESTLGKLRWELPIIGVSAEAWNAHRALLERHEPFRDFDYQLVNETGEKRWFSISGEPIFDDQGIFTGYRGIGRDITERKRADETLAQLAAIIETSNDAIVSRSLDDRILSWNAGAERLFGYTANEAIGQKIAMIFPSDRADEIARNRALLAQGKAIFDLETERLAKGGRRIPVSLSQSPINDERGVMVGVALIFRDISERKQAQAAQAELEAQLRESQKMEAIGTLAGGIAHDFNNIIAIVLGNAALALEDVSASSRAQESLEEIRKAGQRGRDIVQQILSFSRRQPTERKLTALIPIVDESMRLLRATLPARVALEVHCDADVPPVLADATQIQQLLINLATNAMQSMEGRTGHIDIRVDTVMLDAALANRHPELGAWRDQHPGRAVRLAVSDDGPGIDAATLGRIFEPFFTTKPVGEGTGLGLSVVHGIAQTHEGAIVVDSAPGKGTTFTLYLPAAKTLANVPMPDESAAVTAQRPGDDKHVLYLDDDEALVFLVKRLLERRGFRVSGYTNQQEALAALRADPAAFDLVVSDYNMPGMSGLAVAREVHTIRADLTVVVASGFIDEALQANAHAAGVQELIFKVDAVQELCETFARLAQAVGAKSKAS